MCHALIQMCNNAGHNHQRGSIKISARPLRSLSCAKQTVAGLDNLLSGAVVVCKRVAGVGVLVENVRVRDLLVQAVGNTNVRF